ncbi:MAG: hypothetical protein V4490_07415, partial [Pseudomonadota bacterium]
MKHTYLGILLLFLTVPQVSYGDNSVSTMGTQNKPKKQFDSKTLDALLIAEMAASRGNPNLALKNYLEAAERTRDPKVAERATEFALMFSNTKTALKPALIWAETAPNSSMAQTTAAALLLDAGQVKESLPYLAKIQSINP